MYKLTEMQIEMNLFSQSEKVQWPQKTGHGQLGTQQDIIIRENAC